MLDGSVDNQGVEMAAGDAYAGLSPWGSRSSTLGIRLPTPVEHEVKERLFAIDV